MGERPDEMNRRDDVPERDDVARARRDPRLAPTAGETEDPEQIRARMEQTRAEMTETIDAIQDRLNPRHIMEQAKDSVRDATMGRVKDMVNRASDAASDLADQTAETAGDVVESVKQNPIPAILVGAGVAWLLMRRQDDSMNAPRAYNYQGRRLPAGRGETVIRRPSQSTSSGLMDTLRDNPVPAALAGLGLGWLFRSSRQRSSARPYSYSQAAYGRPQTGTDWDRASQSVRTADRARQGASEMIGEAGGRISDAAEGVQDTVSHYASEAREKLSDVGEWGQDVGEWSQNEIDRLLRQNPLAIGAVAVAVGAAVGLAIPETRRENEWMGDARDSLVEQAQDAAQDAVEKVQRVARNVAEEVTDDVSSAVNDE
jgi:ElaB/YqjD/DUF883 family membrane-anchored ribosome-binding protein